MAEALSQKYHVVVANPPYMGGKGMNGKLQEFAKKIYADSKSDLFAMFMERALTLNVKFGMTAMINMQSWMFLSSFEKLRSNLLTKSSIISMAHLGDRAFDSIGGAVVSTTAFVLGKGQNSEYQGTFLNLVGGRSEAAKQLDFSTAIQDPRSSIRFKISTDEFTSIPGAPIVYWISEDLQKAFQNLEPLSTSYTARQGLATAEDDTFLRQWFEVATERASVFGSKENARWFPFTKGGEWRKWYGNNFLFVDWENNGQRLKGFERSVIRNEDTYFSEHLTWSLIGGGLPAFRAGDTAFVFGHKGPALIKTGAKSLETLLCLLNSRAAEAAFGVTSPGLSIEIGHIMNLPVADAELPASLPGEFLNAARSDWDAYETSWDFTTLPLLSPEHRSATLADSYATLRTHWQSMTDEMQRLEEENNRIFIDAYGLQDELTPEVPIEEITLTCNPAYRYGVKSTEADRETRLRADTMAEFLSYAVGCMFGRYSLDEPGLILANQGERLEDYLARIPEPQFMPDKDNVIPVLDGDWFPDDITELFRLFLRVTLGEAHFRENLRYIEDALGKDIRKYFTKDFYADHVKRYKKRPIYWMFSSPKGTFNALIYMHRYRPDTVSVLLNDYLREFISKLEGERGRLEKLSDDPSASQGQRTKALKDMAVIAKQIDELNEWERDVVFPLAQAKIEIDLDDGVKANYPKFGEALKKIPGLEASDD
jgi:type II restriction/modification system DNA methylase subunit YeeA